MTNKTKQELLTDNTTLKTLVSSLYGRIGKQHQETRKTEAYQELEKRYNDLAEEYENYSLNAPVSTTKKEMMSRRLDRLEERVKELEERIKRNEL